MADPVALIIRFEQAQTKAQETLDKLLAEAVIQSKQIAELRDEVAQLKATVETSRKGGK